MIRNEEYRNKKGQLHRIGGPAYIIEKRKEWWNNGAWHRIDGPAIIDDEKRKIWYFNGKCHRVDGPAYINGDHQEWWINGRISLNYLHDYIHEDIKECNHYVI